MWNLPRPGIKPLSPTLADGVLTTGPSGKSQALLLALIDQNILFFFFLVL